MARGRTITNDEVAKLAEQASDLAAALYDAANTYRDKLGTTDEHVKRTEHARVFAGLAKSAADLSQAILVRMAMDEHRRDLEREIHARLAEDKTENERKQG